MQDGVKYPFLNLSDVTAPHRDEFVEAVTSVIDSGRYIGGEVCNVFERELARLTGVKYCVGVSNGLDALRLIFRAYVELGLLRRGEHVIVPANTYIASVLAITDNDLVPIFVEPDAHTLNLDWTQIAYALTDKTRAVLTVHLYGRISWDADVAHKLRERGILIVEDNAQAIGAMTANGIASGALGDAAAFSFYPTKNIGAMGDAGAVTTDNKSVADMIRALANYGSDRRYHNIVKGYNCRLDPIQAAILNVKLNYISEENRRRSEIATVYSSSIKNPKIKLPLSGVGDMVWHQYVVQTDDRKKFTDYLDANGVGWDIHYATPPHLQPCYTEYKHLRLPITENIANTVVSLPISPSTTSEHARKIAEIINGF